MKFFLKRQAQYIYYVDPKKKNSFDVKVEKKFTC